jgi:hypothetical protein
MSILESQRHMIHIAHSLTLVTPSVCGWEAFPRSRPSPTLGSIGLTHQRRRKYWVSVRCPPCARGVLVTPYGKVHNMYIGLQMDFFCLRFLPNDKMTYYPNLAASMKIILFQRTPNLWKLYFHKQ